MFQVKTDNKIVVGKSGYAREEQGMKPLFGLCDLDALERWAVHMTKGAKKYGRDNWRQACTQEDLEHFKDSAFRHFIKWYRGDIDEDHMAALFFNLAGAEMVYKKLCEKKSG